MDWFDVCSVGYRYLMSMNIKEYEWRRTFNPYGMVERPQQGHNGFNVRDPGSAGYLTIETGTEPVSTSKHKGSHRYVQLICNEKELIDNCMEIELITITAEAIFIGHGYVQQTGSIWNGKQVLVFHMYEIPDGRYLRAAISNAYGRSSRRRGDINRPDLS